MPLGMGTKTVAIPFDLIAVKTDRVDLSLTSAEVRERDVSA